MFSFLRQVLADIYYVDICVKLRAKCFCMYFECNPHTTALKKVNASSTYILQKNWVLEKLSNLSKLASTIVKSLNPELSDQHSNINPKLYCTFWNFSSSLPLFSQQRWNLEVTFGLEKKLWSFGQTFDQTKLGKVLVLSITRYSILYFSESQFLYLLKGDGSTRLICLLARLHM